MVDDTAPALSRNNSQEISDTVLVTRGHGILIVSKLLALPMVIIIRNPKEKQARKCANVKKCSLSGTDDSKPECFAHSFDSDALSADAIGADQNMMLVRGWMQVLIRR